MGIIKKDSMQKAHLDFNETLAQICIKLGEQITFLEDKEGENAFTWDWDIDMQLTQLAEELYVEWQTGKSYSNYIADFVSRKVEQMQLAYEAEKNEENTKLINSYFEKAGKTPIAGNIVNVNITQQHNRPSDSTNESIKTNVFNMQYIYNGYGWIEQK